MHGSSSSPNTQVLVTPKRCKRIDPMSGKRREGGDNGDWGGGEGEGRGGVL